MERPTRLHYALCQAHQKSYNTGASDSLAQDPPPKQVKSWSVACDTLRRVLGGDDKDTERADFCFERTGIQGSWQKTSSKISSKPGLPKLLPQLPPHFSLFLAQLFQLQALLLLQAPEQLQLLLLQIPALLLMGSAHSVLLLLELAGLLRHPLLEAGARSCRAGRAEVQRRRPVLGPRRRVSASFLPSCHGVSKNSGPFLGVPITRSIVHWGLLWGLLFLETHRTTFGWGPIPSSSGQPGGPARLAETQQRCRT